MSLPLLKTGTGKTVDLEWTRLKPASEVTLRPPPPPKPTWRPGLSLGPEANRQEGEGFDRRSVVSAVVEADDGVFLIGGKEVRGRPATGKALSYEPDRAWTAHELDHAELAALKILKAHDFPILIQWPAGVWAWSDGGLFWAAADAHSVLVKDGIEDAGMSGVMRGGLGWPVSPHPEDAVRSGLFWPRFSAFGWAMEVMTQLEFRRVAVAGAQRLTVQAMRLAVEDRAGAGSSPFDEERVRAFIADELAAVWRLGFDLGGYLSEHRVRSLHGEMLERGQKHRRFTADGAASVNAQRRALICARQAQIKEAAPGVLSHDTPPEGYKTWSVEALASALFEGWPDSSERPSVSTLKADIRALGGVAKLAAVVG